jgi:hypothetical protein
MIPFCSPIYIPFYIPFYIPAICPDWLKIHWAGLTDRTGSSQKFLGFQNSGPDQLGGLAMNTGPAQRLLRSQTGPKPGKFLLDRPRLDRPKWPRPGVCPSGPGSVRTLPTREFTWIRQKFMPSSPGQHHNQFTIFKYFWALPISAVGSSRDSVA